MNGESFSPSPPLPPQNMTKDLDWIELFTPQEILQDFNFEKLVEENGIYRNSVLNVLQGKEKRVGL